MTAKDKASDGRAPQAMTQRPWINPELHQVPTVGNSSDKENRRALQICSKAPAIFFGLARDHEVIHGQTPTRTSPIATGITGQ